MGELTAGEPNPRSWSHGGFLAQMINAGILLEGGAFLGLKISIFGGVPPEI